jgi:SulP family sulfate permease
MARTPEVLDPDSPLEAAPALPRPFASLRGYRPGWLKSDVAAGLAIAAVGLPTAIAYPAIAGLPPETGLYASIAPLIGYALLGPSRQLIVGPDAATISVLAGVLATVVSSVPGATPDDRMAAAMWIAICVGLICLLARFFRLGALASFLSRPILVGFFAGVSISILTGQIGRVTGMKIESDGLVLPVLEVIRRAGEIHWPSLFLAAAMFALLQAVRAVRLPVPGPVAVVIVAIVLSALLGFEQRGIAVVGALPSGLPSIGLPPVGSLPIGEIVLGSAAVFLVSFGAGIITARSFGARTGEQVDPNAELVGFGTANIAAGLFGGFPITASDSRTAVNISVGGRTQVASLVAAAALVGALLYFGALLSVLPIPALGAILAAAALSLIDLDSLRQIWRISRIEFVFALVALAGAVNFGVLQGVAVAIAATLAHVVYKGMHPRIAMLGRKPGRDGFYKLHRSAEVQPVPGMVIALVQGNLLFFTCDHARSRLGAIAEAMPADTRWFVLDAAGIPHVDSTSAAMLEDFRADLAKRGVGLVIAEMHTEARQLLDRAGVIDAVGQSRVFEDLADAVNALEQSDPRGNTVPRSADETGSIP